MRATTRKRPRQSGWRRKERPMRDLNAMAQEYRPHAPTEIENNLIMNWYPRRIIERSGPVESLLELGLGHGFTAKYFSEASSHHVIIDGASKIIDTFKGE